MYATRDRPTPRRRSRYSTFSFAARPPQAAREVLQLVHGLRDRPADEVQPPQRVGGRYGPAHHQDLAVGRLPHLPDHAADRFRTCVASGWTRKQNVYVCQSDEGSIESQTLAAISRPSAARNVADQVPVGKHFVTYEGLPSDWYLKLTGAATRMIRGEIPLSEKIPANLPAAKK